MTMWYKTHGVATRLQRNCSEQVFLAERTTEYKGYLINQGYPTKLVEDQFSKALTTSRTDLLRTRAKAKKKLFPFVTTYNPNLPDVGRIIRKHLGILESNPKLKEFFPPNSIIASFRRSKNLKELLALVMALTLKLKRLLRLRVALNVKEQDVISVAITLLNQILSKVFKQARAIRYDRNFLVIQKMSFIWLRVRNVTYNILALQQQILELDFATTSLLC